MKMTDTHAVYGYCVSGVVFWNSFNHYFEIFNGSKVLVKIPETKSETKQDNTRA